MYSIRTVFAGAFAAAMVFIGAEGGRLVSEIKQQIVNEQEAIEKASAAIQTSLDAAHQNDREHLGKIVREEWIRWAKEQPLVKPSWLAPGRGCPSLTAKSIVASVVACSRWAAIPLCLPSTRDLVIPGNCILGAFVLWLRHGGMVELHPSKPTWITHCVMRGQDGRRRHFRLVHDFLPLPIGYFLFMGCFEELP